MHTKRQNPSQVNRSYPFLMDSIVNSSFPVTQPTTNGSVPMDDGVSGNLSTTNAQPKTDKPTFGSITYIPKVTDALGRMIKAAVPDMILANKPYQQTRSLFTNMKHKVAKEDRSGVVYRIDCTDCQQCYIGETKQKLKTRLSQHAHQVNKLNPLNPTALTQHAQRLSHTFDFESAIILKSENVKRRLQLQEVHQIILNENVTCNFKTDSADITPTYYNLILSSKTE